MGSDTEQTKKPTLTNWMVNDFPLDIKNEFMGLAKARGQNWKSLLANLLRGWVWEAKKGLRM